MNDGSPGRREGTGRGSPRLDRLTWPAVVAWLRRDPRLMVPVGTCLQHGPHLPLGSDTLIIDRLASEIASRHAILLAPTVPYGASSERESAYAGTASLDSKTLHRVLNDIVGDWSRQGLREVILLTAHGYGPHVEALATVVAGRVRVRAVDINAVDVAPVLDGRRPIEHAGEIETSLLLHLAPELVHASAVGAPAGPPGGSAPEPSVDGGRRSLEPVPPPGSEGVVGRPWLASAEKGRRLFEYLVDVLGERLAA